MRATSTIVALAIIASLGCTSIAQAAPCKGNLTYGTLYARRMGGGYLEYLNVVHNATERTLTFTMRVWGLRAPDSAKAASQTFTLGPKGRVDVPVAYSTSQYFGQSMRREFDVTTPNNFPTLSLTDCTP